MKTLCDKCASWSRRIIIYVTSATRSHHLKRTAQPTTASTATPSSQNIIIIQTPSLTCTLLSMAAVLRAIMEGRQDHEDRDPSTQA